MSDHQYSTDGAQYENASLRNAGIDAARRVHGYAGRAEPGKSVSAIESHSAALAVVRERLDGCNNRVRSLITRAFGAVEEVQTAAPALLGANRSEPSGAVPMLSLLTDDVNAKINQLNNLLTRLEALV